MLSSPGAADLYDGGRHVLDKLLPDLGRKLDNGFVFLPPAELKSTLFHQVLLVVCAEECYTDHLCRENLQTLRTSQAVA